MKSITVNASGRYEIRLGAGILPSLGTVAKRCVSGRRAMIVTDENVAPLYCGAAERSLKAAGFSVDSIVIPPGEESKSFPVYQAVCERLAAERYSRSDFLVALGGGVVGDLAGFAAATYLRGIALIQVPTTLLAMLDSSVGGKTGIDLSCGKNLVGAFWQPAAVIADTDLLSTLPARELTGGRGEAYKYALLDREIYRYFSAHGFDETFYAMCIAYKRDIVEADERESGCRKFLNLGHTVGHAVELLSGFTESHGACVAKGLSFAAELSEKLGILESGREEIRSLLSSFDLSVPYLKRDLIAAIAHDKKADGEAVEFVLLRGIGAPVLVKKRLDEWEKLL